MEYFLPLSRLQIKKTFFVLFKAAAATLLFLLFITGCDLYGEAGEDDINVSGTLPETLVGEWIFPVVEFPSERYLIDAGAVQYGYGGSSEGATESVYDYKGNIRFVSNYSDTSGVIIVEYTDRPSYSKYNGNSFFAIYYQNLKSETVQLANAINLSDLSAPDTETLEEAVEKFTLFKMGKFVNWGHVQPQTRVR